MTSGTQMIRAALLVLALTACGSAAAQVPVTGAAQQQRSSDAYLTAGEGSAEGTGNMFGGAPLAAAVGESGQGAALVP